MYLTLSPLRIAKTKISKQETFYYGLLCKGFIRMFTTMRLETHRLNRLKIRIKCIHTYRVSVISNLRRIKGENESFNVTLASAKRFHLMANNSISLCQKTNNTKRCFSKNEHHQIRFCLVSARWKF